MEKKTIEINEPWSRLKKFFIDIVDIIAFLVFIVWLFLAIKVFVVAPVIVRWHSMLPNYNDWGYIFIDKFYYKLDGGIKRWDVVVVMPKTSDVSFLKRVIWLPWDTITIKSWNVFLCKKEDKWLTYHNNDIYQNKFYKDSWLICKELKEPYIRWKTVNLKGYSEKIYTESKCWIDKFVLKKWQYLVFWDDRMYSTDSRCCFVWYCSWSGSIYYVTKNEILWKVRGLKF